MARAIDICIPASSMRTSMKFRCSCGEGTGYVSEKNINIRIGMRGLTDSTLSYFSYLYSTLVSLVLFYYIRV